jgi:hypothetical protein
MTLRVIGAGVGRTGTTSLKLALDRLLGARCYHMYEVFQHPEHVALWHSAVRGARPDWDAIYGGYGATVDWPGAAFWQPLSESYPDAIVLLSVRDKPEAWFRSVEPTISAYLQRKPQPELAEWHAMAVELLATTFAPVPFNRASAIAAYERHNAAVRASVPTARLLEWQPADGWAPLCERLGLAVPDDPFPHANTTEDYQAVLARVPARPPWHDRALGRIRRS